MALAIGGIQDVSECGDRRQIADPDTPETILQTKERAAAVRAAQSGLMEQHRRVIELRYGQEMTLREIGHELGITEAAASKLHSLALRRLKASLALMGVSE